LAAFICSNNFDYRFAVIAGLAGAIVNAAGNIINDIFDLEIDKINRPQRPLPSGIMTTTFAINAYVYLSFFALILAYYNLNLNSFLIVVITSVMMFLYSFILKGIRLVGNIVVSFFTGLAFVFGSVVVNNFYCGIIPAVFAFQISLMREIVKDIEDIEGDKEIGISTFPIKYGIDKSIKLITIIGCVLIISTTIPFVLQIYNWYYFAFVTLTVNGILGYSMQTLNKDTSTKSLRTVSTLLKVGMILGVISIYLGVNF